MKKISFLGLIIFSIIINTQNLFAQKKYTLSTGTKKMEIVGKLTYKSETFGTTSYLNIEKDKIVIWESEDKKIVKSIFYFKDMDKDAIEISESSTKVLIPCIEGKHYEMITYSNDEEEVKKGYRAIVEFDKKSEAKSFMSKIRKILKKS